MTVDQVTERDVEVLKRGIDRTTRIVRRVYESVRDIGDVPVPADPQRRRACAASFEQFMLQYHPQTFALPFSVDHREVIKLVENAVWEGGLGAIALPRASGKSSILTSACEFGILNGFQEFIVLIGSDAPSAEQMLNSIRGDFELNEALVADYPEILYPFIKLEGSQQRAAAQLHHGRPTRLKLGPRMIVLPTIAPEWPPEYAEFLREDGTSKAAGHILKVAGITGGIRGMLAKRSDGTSIRPTMVIVDDPQTDASSRSPVQCLKRERVLGGAILGLAGPSRRICGVMAATVITQGDMADVILDRKLHPEWSGMRKKMVYSWPKHMDLWGDYHQIRVLGQQKEEGTEACNQFLRDHWEKMHEGAKIAWEERKNPDELSGLHHAMNLYFDRGEATFMAEYQNEPLSELTGSADDVTAEQVMKNINRHPRGIVPLGCEYITLAVDVQKSLLYYTVIAWHQDFTGHVLTYGTWPDQKQLYFTTSQARHTIQKALPSGDLESQLYGALEALVPRLMDAEWPRDDGTVFKISKGLIDSGWGQSANTIHRWVRQSRYQGLILPSVGKYIGASGNPMSTWAKHPGDKTGLNYRIRSMEGRKAVRSVLFDSNWYKSFLHNRLRVPPGGKSGISLFGDKPEIHRLFADHLTKSEYRVTVEAKNASGRIVEEWKTRPERSVENHWLDCCALNCVGAMILGVVVEESGKRIEAPPRRVSFEAIAKAHQSPVAVPAVGGKVSFRDLQQRQRQQQALPRRP